MIREQDHKAKIDSGAAALLARLAKHYPDRDLDQHLRRSSTRTLRAKSSSADSLG